MGACGPHLSIVVLGSLPASVNVLYHRDHILNLLSLISLLALLRMMSIIESPAADLWSFCIAGCLAEPAQEIHLRAMVETLQPPSIFGRVHRALETMEYAWRNQDAEDLAVCFKS